MMASFDFKIRALEPEETIAIRHSVLRPNQSIEQCRYAGDREPTTFHIGAVCDDGEVVGIATVLRCDESRYSQFSSLRQFRLRGMAVVPSFQRQGIGTNLLNACLKEAMRCECQIFWCNARLAAVDFYVRCGLAMLNDAPFDIDGIGPHHVMFKQVELSKVELSN